MAVPNLPDESVPVGSGEDRQREVRRWGTPAPSTSGEGSRRPGRPLGLDFDTGAKLSGSLHLHEGPVARLHRALAQFMLDVQTGGARLHRVLHALHRQPRLLEGTGQLPKFKATCSGCCAAAPGRAGRGAPDLHLRDLADQHRARRGAGRIRLPIKLTAHSPASALKPVRLPGDTRGLIRQHQFDKGRDGAITIPSAAWLPWKK